MASLSTCHLMFVLWVTILFNLVKVVTIVLHTIGYVYIYVMLMNALPTRVLLMLSYCPFNGPEPGIRLTRTEVYPACQWDRL